MTRGGAGYTPAGAANRATLVSRGWIITDQKCPGAWPDEEVRMSMPVLPEFEDFTSRVIPAMKDVSITLTGKNLELIRSGLVAGNQITVSAPSATSVTLEIPGVQAGTHDVVLQTANGSLRISGALNAQHSERLEVRGLNPRSSFINRATILDISSWTIPDATVVCIAYNDRPGLVARAKAKSRAEHACRIAAAAGAQTRIFVYGKAPSLAESVRLITKSN